MILRRSLLASLPFAVSPCLAQTGKLPVVASFSILADMVHEIGGDAVAVTGLVGPDTDAHGFQPRPSDLRAVQGARLVVLNGLGFDPWMDRLVRAAAFEGPVVRAAEGVRVRAMEGEGHEEGGAGRLKRHALPPKVVRDPHAWQDLGNVPVFTRNILAGLVAADPARRALFEARAQEFIRRAAETDAAVHAQIAMIPAARRKVITSHDAFGYFGAAYGIEMSSPQGVTTEGEPSAAEVGRLIRQAKQDGVSAIFMENMTNPRLLEQVAREIGVAPGGTLYADALSGPDGPAPTYLAMMRHNVTALVAAMGPR